MTGQQLGGCLLLVLLATIDSSHSKHPQCTKMLAAAACQVPVGAVEVHYVCINGVLH